MTNPSETRVFTTPIKVLLGLGLLAVILIVWRFAAGLGPTTSLSAGFPWGIWIAFDVVTGTALACGGYAMALLVYIFNSGRYHPLVRPAILTGALGYTLAALSIMIDVGRPWNLWKVPLMLWDWNVNSVLLEVAVCMMAYTFVLWIELAPTLLERWRDSSREWKRNLAAKSAQFFEKALIWIIALGILLPTMHQSSLGTLMLLGGPKLHPLWNSMLLPPFFLLTCLSMGYAMVVFETIFASRVFGRKPELKMLVSLQRTASWAALVFVGFRIFDVVSRQKEAYLVRLELPTFLFWLEIAIFLTPVVLMMRRADQPQRAGLLREAMLIGAGGALYRIDTFLVAFNPGPEWHYFPSVAEIMITVGLVSLELAGYAILVKMFPAFGGVTLAPKKTSTPSLPEAVPSLAR
jgi:Ni/Fe-hydrogenase subunit HybB-like protein